MDSENAPKIKSGRGGARPGAGRKKGSCTKLSQAIRARAAATGVMPLEVMLTAMRQAWDEKDLATAVIYAEKAAPYVHPKLASTSVSIDDKRDLDDFDTHELIAAVHAQADPRGTAEAEAGNREPDSLH